KYIKIGDIERGYLKEQINKLRKIKEIFDKMDHIEYDPSTIPVTKHPDAIYTSRILKSTNLPQPINSNKVIIIGSTHGNYLIYLIQCHHYFIFIITILINL